MTEEQMTAPEQEEVTEAAESEAVSDEQEVAQDGVQEEKAEEKEEERVSPAKARRERRKAEMERLRKEAREASERLQRMQEQLEKAREAAQSKEPPKEDDFDDYNQYLIALGAYQSARAITESKAEEIEAEAKEVEQEVKALSEREQIEAARNWAAQIEDAKSRYADFEQVALAPDLPINDTMARLIAQSDVGADISYYLGTNRTEAQQIAAMDDISAALAIGRLEARVARRRTETTSAPEPINPVRPKASAGNVNPDKMSYEEYRKARMDGKIR